MPLLWETRGGALGMLQGTQERDRSKLQGLVNLRLSSRSSTAAHSLIGSKTGALGANLTVMEAGGGRFMGLSGVTQAPVPLP